jgi:hypothetical protein
MTPPTHARDWMQVTGNLTLGAGWFVAKDQCTDRQRSSEAAADAGRGDGVVIAGDPNPIAPALEFHKRRSIGRSDAS